MWVTLDLETTGLSPKQDDILECAVAEIDFDGHRLKEVLRHRSWVINHDLKDLCMDSIVRDMHTKNGLLEEIRLGVHRGTPRGAWSDEDLDLKLCEFVRGAPPRSVVLVGNSIHFDRAFLVARCPTFHSRLHHRMVDVSTLNQMRDRFGAPIPKPEATHRAMDDVLSSINQLMQHVKTYNSTKETE